MIRVCLLIGVLGACGPIAYVSAVTRSAATSVDAAREANAAKYSPYWWTRATEYLHKARENASRADFQGANRWGKLADEAAQQAIVEAETGKGEARANAGKLVPAKTGGDGDDDGDNPIAPAKETP